MAIGQLRQEHIMSGNVIIAFAVILLILENPTSATSDKDKECVFRCLKPSKNYMYTDDQRRCRGCSCEIGEWCKKFIGTCETKDTAKPGGRDKTKDTTSAPFIGICETTTGGRQNVMKETTEAPTKASRCRTKSESGISIGLAIGLSFVGITFGVIVTSLLCVCVPKLNKNATTIIMGNWTSRGNGKQETTGLDHHVRRTAINNGNDSRDSSIYNTIQFDIPFASHGPMELGLTNSKSSAQSLKAITSLEYTVVTDNIIESSSPSEQQTYQSLNKRTLDIASYNLEPLERSSYSSNTQNPARAEINVSADRNYFKLEPCSTTASDMESGEQEGDDRSAYFVLEKSGTSHSSIDPPDVSYSEPSHETHVGNIDLLE